MSARARRIAFALAAAVLSVAVTASAQRQGRRQSPPPAQHAAPSHNDSEDEEAPAPRTEPEIAPPADPLLLSPETRDRIGSDYSAGAPSPEGGLKQTQWFPYYEERRGDYRLRLLPPLVMEQSRGLRDPSQDLYGVPKTEDTQGLYALLYYRRRSQQLDMDLVFPAFWHVRDGDSHVTVAGPVVHREAPGEHDNWIAPLFFEGQRKDGGYFHSPLLLTTTHWGAEGAFTLVGPYFRTRTGSDVDMGLAPLLFHGNNGNLDGNRRSYTLIPPLLFYHSEHELDGTSMTVAGPVIAQSDPKHDVLDVLPFYYHIHGKPESGGSIEEHTTVFPFFHYGYDPEKSLFILPGYYRRVSHTADTLLSLFYSHVTARSGATSLTAIGPGIPLFWDYRDRDLGVHSTAVVPFYFTSDSPAGHDWLTPLVGHFQTYGESRTTWVFPTLTINSNTHGWENDFHPLVYVGRSDNSSHTVVAPFYWDFANPNGRATVGFPVFWRFTDKGDDSIVQVAANTVYTQKRTAAGLDWQFHLVPLFSYGENPTGYFWNVLFGLAGYTRDGASAQVRALWIPFSVGGAPPSQTALR